MKSLLLAGLIVGGTMVPIVAQITTNGIAQGVFTTTAGVANAIPYTLQGGNTLVLGTYIDNVAPNPSDVRYNGVLANGVVYSDRVMLAYFFNPAASGNFTFTPVSSASSGAWLVLDLSGVNTSVGADTGTGASITTTSANRFVVDFFGANNNDGVAATPAVGSIMIKVAAANDKGASGGGALIGGATSNSGAAGVKTLGWANFGGLGNGEASAAFSAAPPDPPAVGQILGLTDSDSFVVKYRGTAGRDYALEASTTLGPGDPWETTHTRTADPTGLVTYTNPMDEPREFYRVKDVTLPMPVTGLMATPSHNVLSLTWTASAEATSYNVKRATVFGGPYTTLATVTGTSFNNTGLINGITYFYVISAVNHNGETANSPVTSAIPGDVSYKPRIIVTTDMGADPDDQQSMVRLLACSNDFDIEGLITSTGCWRKTQSNTTYVNNLINAYSQARPNLSVHAAGYPTVAYLNSINKLGQTGYSIGDVGAGKDSAGSDLIIAAMDKPDPRPVWVQFWGGGNNLAQAIWKVQNTRTPAQLASFLSKIRVFDILGQDDTGAWMTKNFPNLFYIRAKKVYGWAPPKNGEYEQMIQTFGPLGAAYPATKYAPEGDTPSFMHVYPNGLNDPEQIDQGGWGGRFSYTKVAASRGMEPVTGESAYDPYSMWTDTSESNAIKRWENGYNNDFHARMLWSVTSDYAGANHHPVAVVNGNTTRQVIQISAAAGSSVPLSSAGSSDPEGHPLFYSWSHYVEPSSYKSTVTIQNNTTATATVLVPANAGGQNIHVILQLRDNGTPDLYAYRRVIINVQ